MPNSVEALVIIALVVSPGFIFTQLARRTIAHIPEPTDIRFLVSMVTTSAILHSLVFPWSSRIIDYYLNQRLYGHRWEVFLWAVVTLLVLPALLGTIAGLITIWEPADRLLDKIGLGYIDRMPSAWDYVMQQKRARYVRVHLKDGKSIVGGVFADRSFGSTDPRRGDVYLEEAWTLDEAGNYLEPIPTSQGVWISHDVMAYVHFLEGADETYDDEQRKPTPHELSNAESDDFKSTARRSGYRQPRRATPRQR